ncbi:MAG: hypothetical protein GY810_19690 [Aureispira sp.]|nr:hypothetical protein [Aureispira sp.]
MKNWICLLSICLLFLACNRKSSSSEPKKEPSINSKFISVKDAGLDDPNNKIVGNWTYTVEGCVNDKNIKETIHLGIRASGVVETGGNAFECNGCSQTFKITKDQLLPANCTYNSDGSMSISSESCTELKCDTDFCGKTPRLISLSNMNYTLEGDVLTIKQNGATFTLSRRK